jgi:valyl-tRNA synthetase
MGEEQLSAMSLEDVTTTVPTNDDPLVDTSTTTKLSKNQLKKLAKGQSLDKKKDKKDKPTWNQPGEGKKAKEKANLAAVVQKKNEIFINDTPPGQKKDVNKLPMADAYQPQAVEAAWQDWWEASGYYTCNPTSSSVVGRTTEEKFVMVIPPPNVTGSLHLGHALTAAVEDTLTRWHRMLGHATLYVPGKSSLFFSCPFTCKFVSR